MKRQQAFKLMFDGAKITHPQFDVGEYIFCHKGGKIKSSDGSDQTYFWLYDKLDQHWDDDRWALSTNNVFKLRMIQRWLIILIFVLGLIGFIGALYLILI